MINVLSGVVLFFICNNSFAFTYKVHNDTQESIKVILLNASKSEKAQTAKKISKLTVENFPTYIQMLGVDSATIKSKATVTMDSKNKISGVEKFVSENIYICPVSEILNPEECTLTKVQYLTKDSADAKLSVVLDYITTNMDFAQLFGAIDAGLDGKNGKVVSAFGALAIKLFQIIRAKIVQSRLDSPRWMTHYNRGLIIRKSDDDNSFQAYTVEQELDKALY